MTASNKYFKQLSEIVYAECGINLHSGKKTLLQTRLSKCMRACSIKSVKDYLELIKRDANEFMNFIDAVSTNHTYFYRENHHCEYILSVTDKSEHLNIWSAASSSGEEAFSLSFQLLENGYAFNIYASDISTSMLNIGRRGIYHIDKLKNVPLQTIRKFCKKGANKWSDHIKIKNAVKEYVSFERLNLLSDSPPGIFDIIFCRNVMIYFDNSTRQTVVNKLFGALKDGGYFVIGASESLMGIKHKFTTVRPSIYRK